MNMNRSRGPMVGMAALAASALLAAAAVTQVTAGDDATRATDTAADLDGVQQVLVSLREAGYTRVLEIEHEDGGFEVEALDADGREVELMVKADGTLHRLDDRDEGGHDD